MDVILYTRSDCPLCERARSMLEGLEIQFEALDISQDVMLLRRFRQRIPVVMRTRDSETLDWPFDDNDLQELIS